MALKISDIIGNKIIELPNVIDLLNTPPTTPTTGGRYLINNSPTGVWVSKTNQIAEWNGSTWVYTIPNRNNIVYVDNLSSTYKFNGVEWLISIGDTINQNGNEFNKAINIGSNDYQDLNFKTNGIDRFSIDKDGKLFLPEYSGTTKRLIQVTPEGEIKVEEGSGDLNTIFVSPMGDDNFDGTLINPVKTISEAVNRANLTASETNPTLVYVTTGIYYEPPITLAEYVFIKGFEQDSTYIVPTDVNNPLITCGNQTGVYHFSLSGVTNNCAIQINNTDSTVINKVYINNCLNGIEIVSDTIDSYSYLEYVSIDNCEDTYIKINGLSGFTNYVNIENTYSYIFDVGLNYVFDIDGTSNVICHTGGIVNDFDAGQFVGFNISNEANLYIRNYEISRFDKGINVNSNSTGTLEITACNFIENDINFYINSVNTKGFFDGYTDYDKQYIIGNNIDFFITNRDAKVIRVSKKGGDFNNIVNALNSITDASPTNRYQILVGAGIFIEDTIQLKEYVDIVGSSFTSTIIQIDSSLKNIIIASPNSGLFNLQLSGATGIGTTAISYEGGNGIFRCVEVRFNQNRSFYKQTSTYAPFATSIFLNCSAESNSGFETAFEITDEGTYTSTFAMNGFIYSGDGETFLKAYGTRTQIDTRSFAINKNNLTGYGLQTYDGAVVSINSASLIGFQKGLFDSNLGAGSTYYVSGLNLRNCTTDIQIDNISTIGSIQGNFTRTKFTIVPDSPVSFLFNDVNGDGTTSLGNLYLGKRFDRQFEAVDLFTVSSSLGLHEGGELTLLSGTTFSINEGHGYIEDDSVSPEWYKRIEWVTSGITIPLNSDLYVFYNFNNILTTSSSLPSLENNVVLGRVVTNATGVEFYEQTKNDADHLPNKLENVLRNVFQQLFVSGGLLTTNTNREFSVSQGEYFVGVNLINFNGKNISDNFTPIYRSSTPGQFLKGAETSIVTNTVFDDGSGTLASISNSNYVKNELFLTNNGTEDTYYLLLSQNEYTSEQEAIDSPVLIKPSYFREQTVKIADIITRGNHPTYITVVDTRPIPSFKSSASGGGGVTSHLDLTELTNGDAGHTQFLMLDGSKSMSGNLNLNGNNIINTNTINGLNISSHSSRHIRGGSDALPFGTPISISRKTPNFSGITTNFSLADHTHTVLEEEASVYNGAFTYTLDNTANNKLILTGTLEDQIINLGAAGEYIVGKTFKIYNERPCVISIEDDGGTEIYRLEPYSYVEFILINNTTSEGVWSIVNTTTNENKIVRFYEDFIAATIGQTNWTSSQSGGGGSSIFTPTTTISGIGLIRCNTGTSSSGIVAFNRGTTHTLLGSTLIIVEVRVLFTLLSNSTERYISCIGMGDNTGSGDMFDGVYFEYSELVSGNVWRLKTANNNIRTAVVTTSPIVANTWYDLRIEVNRTGTSAKYFVNNTFVGQITTNIPITTARETGYMVKIKKSVGTTARDIIIDYFNIKRFL